MFFLVYAQLYCTFLRKKYEFLIHDIKVLLMRRDYSVCAERRISVYWRKVEMSNCDAIIQRFNVEISNFVYVQT